MVQACALDGDLTARDTARRLAAEEGWAAAQGEGAYRDGVRLAVSPCAEMTAATVECGWSTRRPAADYTALIGRILGAGAAIRRAGSGALGLADVAVLPSQAR